MKDKKLIECWNEAIKDKICLDDLKRECKNNHPSLTSIVFTRECFLRCKHCCYPVANCQDIDLGSLEKIDQVIDATFKVGNRDLIHIGRILKKEHLPILKKYQDKGMSINLIDNGGGQSLIKDIKKMGLFFTGGIDVSVDGTKQSHEAQRGPGTYALAASGIEAFKEVADHIAITATASALNFDTIVPGLLELKEKYPFIKVLQITTTAPMKTQTQRMHLTKEEMVEIFNQLMNISHKNPPRLLIYRNDDLMSILDELMKHGKPIFKHIHMEWKINNLTVAYFPESIVAAEEFAIDANGRHILPFGLDHHLDERPEDWEMQDDLILTDPDKSYELLVDKFFKVRGDERFKQEKKIFKKYNLA